MNNQLKIHISPPSNRINPCRHVLVNFPLPARGESATCHPPALAVNRLSQPHAICLPQLACHPPTSACLCRMLYAYLCPLLRMLYACSSGMQPACLCRLPFVCFSYRLLACPSGMLLPANSCMPPACPCRMPLACLCCRPLVYLCHISLACLGHVHMSLVCPC